MNKDMVKFSKKAFFLVIPIALLLGFMENRLQYIPNGYNKKRAALEDQLDSIHVLVLGASQSLYGINPDQFSYKGFNLSNVSQTIFYDTQLSLKYLERMKALKCVLVTVSYFSFWYELDDTKEAWRDYYYTQFFGIRHPELKWYDSKAYSLIMLYTPLNALRYAKHGFKIDLSGKLARNGWLKVDTISGNSRISDLSGKERVSFHDKNRVASRFNGNYEALENFVKICQQRNVRVVFITPPVLPTYYKYTNPEINRKNAEAIQTLCAKYDIQYFDYFKNDKFTYADFYDNDHLNCVGATKFSTLLNEDIFLRQTRPLSDSSSRYPTKF